MLGAYTAELAASVAALWRDPGIQRAFARRHEFGLSDGAQYLFEHAERFAARDYVPSDADLLRARLPRAGIASVELPGLVLVDVAGQRSDKKRWLHYFEDVRAVLFVASLAEFDVARPLADSAAPQNALRHALALFTSIAQSPWFRAAALLVCLNKRDLFREKLAHGRALKLALPDYSGPNSDDAAFAAVAHAFTAAVPEKRVHVFSLTATDSDSVRRLYDDLKNTLSANAGSAD